MSREGFTDVPHLDSPRAYTDNKSLHAAPEDLEQALKQQNTDLLRLSLQLTADAGRAETCVILALRDCLIGGNIAPDRMLTWIRRQVILHAIRLVWGTPSDLFSDPEFECHLQSGEPVLEPLRESIAMLDLPVLDRLAFVICVLERYSILDAAAFLGRTPREVHQAVVRATDHVTAAEPAITNDGAATPPVGKYGMYSDRGMYFDSSCGSILDYDCR